MKKPLGIRPTLWLAIALTVTSTVLGASALYGYQLYNQSRAAERLRVRTMAETYAAQAAPLLNRPRETVAAFAKNLPSHSDVCLLAVLTRKQEPLAIRGDARLLERYLNSAQRSAAEVVMPIPADGLRAAPELQLAAVPIRLSGSDDVIGTLVCAARPLRQLAMSSGEAWQFFARLLLIAAAGMVLGFWYLKRNVLIPLAGLADRSAQIRRAKAAAGDDAAERADEIGDLARVLSDMHMDLEEWRARAGRLERSVGHRIAAETQKITRELEKTKRKIWIDELTKLGNRRLFQDKFGEIFQAQRDAGQDLAVVMIDIDNFKTLNDTLGHPAGDELLRFVGELLKQSLRGQDLAIRYGGDEFLVILPAVALNDACSIAERTCALFAQQAKLLPIETKPSLSAGVASLWQHRPESAEALLQFADEAVYAAKKSGKNCVEVFEPKHQMAAV